MSDNLDAIVARLRSGSTYDDRTDAADLIEAQDAEITRLRAELATARRDATETPSAFVQWVKREMPPGTIINNPEWWAFKLWPAAIRAAAGEGRQRSLMHLDPSDTRTHIIDESGDLVGLQDKSEKDREP